MTFDSIRSAVADTNQRPFRLVRWFMLMSLFSIGLISVIGAVSLSRFVTEVMLERDMTVSAEYVNSVVVVQTATSYFYGDNINPNAPEMEEFFRHVATLPDVLRANVYGYDRSILWSSNPTLIGKRFDDNDELEAAFRDEAHAEIELVRRGEKAEHATFPPDVKVFIENYLPIWSEDGSRVVGAVEVYKSPEKLLHAIESVRMLIWVGAAAGGIALFAGLTLIMRHASRILAEQEARVVETERLAVVGEMASAVAHGLRNPLAAIRSCAELALEDDLAPDTRETISDIVSQSDRLESWIRSFLTKARQDPEDPHLYRLDDVIRDSLDSFAPQMAARQIDCRFDDSGDSPLIGIAPSELNQVLNALLSNSIEAMDEEGAIVVERRAEPDGCVRLTMTDSGPGLPAHVAERLFEPFATGKSSGLGVGLALARRTVQRLGGTLELANAEPRGVRATLRLPVFEGIA